MTPDSILKISRFCQSLKCWKIYDSGILPKTKGYRCAAPGCREFHATRNKERVAKHVFRDCIKATEEMRRLVKGYLQGIAPSTLLGEMKEKIATKNENADDSDRVRAVKTLRLSTTKKLVVPEDPKHKENNAEESPEMN